MRGLEFKDRTRLLAYVAYLSRSSWEGLEGLRIVDASGAKHRLLVPDGREAEVEDGALTHFEASDFRLTDPEAGFAIVELHARVELVPAEQSIPAPSLIVLPLSRFGPLASGQVAELLRDLSDLGAYGPSIWPVRFTGSAETETTVYRLDARSRVAIDRGLDLSGSPFVLASDPTGRTFVPLGMRHPLLGRYDFLFPPLQDGVFRAWYPIVDGPRTSWRMRHFRQVLGEPTPLLFGVDLASISQPDGLELTPIAGSAGAIGLELGPDFGRHDGQLRMVRRLHRLSSRHGMLGPRILQLLDHAESRANDLTYFYCKSAADGDRVEHFVLESRLAEEQEQFVPTGERVYLQTEGFGRRELPVFVLQGFRFRPNLDALLEAVPGAGEFVGELRGHLGLNGDPSAIAVIEPGDAPSRPRVMILRGGRPLAEAIRFTLEHFHSDRITVATEVAETRVADQIEGSHAMLRELADVECKGVEAEVANVIDDLRTINDECGQTLDGLAERMAALRVFIQDGEVRFAESADQWRDFCDAVFELEAALAEQRFRWLEGFRAKEHELRLALQARELTTTDLQAWCATRHAALAEIVDALRERATELEALVAATNDAATASDVGHERIRELRAAAERAHKEWEVRIDLETKSLCEAREAAVKESTRLAAAQRELERLRSQLLRDVEKNEQETKSLERQSDQLTREKERLEQLIAKHDKKHGEVRDLDGKVRELRKGAQSRRIRFKKRSG